MKSTIKTFIPGSEWLYFKLYTGRKTADKILINEVFRFVNKLERDKYTSKWFFIRYADPDFHLRIRLLVDNKNMSHILDVFYKQFSPLLNRKLIWKVQLDTYSRELERYGLYLIEEAESIFYLDSKCVISILKRINQYKNENYRWLISLKMIDCFLSDFSFDLLSKQKFSDMVNNSFKKEFGFNMYNTKQFNTKYRENKKLIELVLSSEMKDDDFKKLEIPIIQRSKMIKPIIVNIKKKLLENSSKSLFDLLSNYIHMMLDRLFLSDNRVHELVLYDFLYRYYTSKIQRMKYL